MRIVYFISSNFPYEIVLYSGVGPRFAQPFGWPIEPIRSIGETTCDVGLIDGRLTEDDFLHLDAFLASPRTRFPVFFRLSDPDMPTYPGEAERYVFRQKYLPGAHYFSIYDPEGPLLEFVRSLRRSRVVRLPYPYDVSRQVERDFTLRRRRILLSGARSRTLYPLHHALHRKRRWNPLVRWAVSELRHPGYADQGERPQHNLIHERYIEYAAGFTHFFLRPSRYGVELMKYVECGYAGCVPIGYPSRSLAEHVRDCVLPYTGKTMELLRAIRADREEMIQRATRYRSIMRALRDPATLQATLEEQIRALI